MTGFYEGDGTEAGPIPHGLNTHTDVSITGPQNDEVLKYSASTGSWYNGSDVGGTQLALNDLTDTEVPTPSDGNALVWNSTAAKWVDATIITGAAGQLSDLSDVDFPVAPVEGEVLTYTSGIWTTGDPEASATIPNPLKVGNDLGDANVTLAGGGGVSDSVNLSFNREGLTQWNMTVDDTDSIQLFDASLGPVFTIDKYVSQANFDTMPINVPYGGAVLGTGRANTTLGLRIRSGIEPADQNFITFEAGSSEVLYTLKTGLTDVSGSVANAYNFGLYGKNGDSLLTSFREADGSTRFVIETDDSGGTRRSLTLEENGNLAIQGIFDTKPKVSGDTSGLYVQNYNWSLKEAGYHIYALNGSGVDTVLTIAPSRPSNFEGGALNYTGEVEIRVGDVPNGFFTWSFGSDGALWRNGLIVIPAP